MPFNSNDSIDILIRARAEGQEQIKGLDSATKAFIATQQQNDAALAKLAASLDNTNKSIDKMAAAWEKAATASKKGTKEAVDGMDEFTKRLQSVISNPAFSINSPFSLAGRAVQQFAQSLGPVGIIATGAAVGIGAVGIGITDLILKAGQSETALRNFALRLDLPVQAARQLQIEAKLAGVEASTLEASVRTLSAGLADPSGAGKKQAAVLRDLGVATRDLGGNTRDMGEVLIEVYNKLGTFTDKTRLAHDATVIFGRSAKELLPAIELHGQLAGRAKDLSDRYAGVNAEYVKSQAVFVELGIEVDALEKQILLKLIPTLEKAARFVSFLLPSGKPSAPEPKGLFHIKGSVFDPQFDPNNVGNPLGRLQSLNAGQQGSQGLIATNDALEAITKGIDQKYLNPLEKLETKLKSAKEAAAELNKGGIVAVADQKQYDADKKTVASIEAQIKAYKDGITYAKELANARVEGAKRAETAEGAELGTIQKLEAERRSALLLIDTKFKGDPTQRATTNREFDAKETSFYKSESTRLLNEAGETQIEALDHRASLQGKLIELATGEKKTHEDVLKVLQAEVDSAQKRLAVELATPSKKDQAQGNYNNALLQAADKGTIENRQIDIRDKRIQTEADRRIREIQDEADNKRYDQQSKFQSRILEVNSRPGDEVATANQIAQIQYALEQGRLQAELQIAAQEQDINKQKQAELKLRLSDEQHIIDIQDAAILRQAEARKKDLEEFQAGAAKLFDALTSKGGLSSLFKTELHGLEKQVFVNASGLAFDKTDGNGLGLSKIFPNQRDASSGKLTGFGRLLQGTPFGDKGLKDPNAVSIDATAANTLRTANILASMSGVSGTPGSSSVPGFSFLGGGSGSSSAAANPFWFLGGAGGGSSPSPDSLVPGLIGVTYGDLAGASSGASSGGAVASAISNPSSFAGILGSAKAFAGGAAQPSNIWDVLSGNSTASTASQVGSGISAAGVVFGGVEGAIKGFSKGGVSGDSSAIASIAGSAAALDPEPISKAVLAGVALVSSIVGQVFGNNQEKRAADISNYIAGSQHTLPYSQGPISQAFDISGSNVVYGTNQSVRSTGNVTAPVVNFNISNLDSSSFHEYAQTNMNAIASAVNSAALNDHPLVNTIQQRFAN